MQIYFRLKSVFFSARNIWKSVKFCYIMTIYCCIRRRLSCRSVWPKTVTFQDRARIILCNIIFFFREMQKKIRLLWEIAVEFLKLILRNYAKRLSLSDFNSAGVISPL